MELPSVLLKHAAPGSPAFGPRLPPPTPVGQEPSCPLLLSLHLPAAPCRSPSMAPFFPVLELRPPQPWCSARRARPLFLCALLLLLELALRSSSSPWIPQPHPSARSLSVRGAQLRSRLLHCVAARLEFVLVAVDWEQTRSRPYTSHRRSWLPRASFPFPHPRRGPLLDSLELICAPLPWLLSSRTSSFGLESCCAAGISKSLASSPDLCLTVVH
ncbi:uncharacterized protein [Zea mays]|jgi:hypothetical protein|uniref:Uncharacterized protein n=1 Tax=Zea mays TaxID=4577 RepID=A0A804PHU6_MAIZE|nr:uncharacterized protein LOC103626974 [Zea mays]|eukprot:XP_008645557.1 uncharacterized protein LOC103626974 [Zea mays]